MNTTAQARLAYDPQAPIFTTVLQLQEALRQSPVLETLLMNLKALPTPAPQFGDDVYLLEGLASIKCNPARRASRKQAEAALERFCAYASVTHEGPAPRRANLRYTLALMNVKEDVLNELVNHYTRRKKLEDFAQRLESVPHLKEQYRIPGLQPERRPTLAYRLVPKPHFAGPAPSGFNGTWWLHHRKKEYQERFLPT